MMPAVVVGTGDDSSTDYVSGGGAGTSATVGGGAAWVVVASAVDVGVSISVGWVLLLVGGGVSSIAGILGLIANTDAEEAAAEASGDE